MIQTLGDVLMLVAIISLGLVGFLLAVFLYHLIFVAMDLRQVMRRLNDLTSELEEMLMAPVQLVEGIVDWVQKWIWEAYMTDTSSEKKKKRKSKGKKKKKGKRKKADFELKGV
jgi:hypothetical protein